MGLNILSYPQSRYEDSQFANLAAGEPKMNQEFRLEEETSIKTNFEGIVGQSSALKQVLQLVDMVASCDATVLLLGRK